MALSLSEMSDRFEIQDLLVGYCYAVDDKDFDALDQYFTEDAVIDYSEMVGVKGSLADIKAFLRASLGPIPMAQHAVMTTQYKFDGDTPKPKPSVTTRWLCPVTTVNRKPSSSAFGTFTRSAERPMAGGSRACMKRRPTITTCLNM